MVEPKFKIIKFEIPNLAILIDPKNNCLKVPTELKRESIRRKSK